MPAPLIAISSGEPAGVGPDVCLDIASRAPAGRRLWLGDAALFEQRAQQLGLDIEILRCDDPSSVKAYGPGHMLVMHTRTAVPVVAGHADPDNADYVLQLLRAGTQLCIDGTAGALVTAPVHKAVIARSGVAFTGHTEFLAALTGSATPVMLLAGPRLKVALATIHVPLREVADLITAQRLESVLRVLHHDLVARFAIASPRIAVLGLNPHAGEDGLLGREEKEVIEPLLARLSREGLLLEGPLPADTAFTAQQLNRFDAVLAMYHDQGLAPIKALEFGETVNVTLGLPIVRTSVDHGTALPLAGTGKAQSKSLAAAIALAGQLAVNQTLSGNA